jgi:UDP-glucuronate 4-epimerase
LYEYLCKHNYHVLGIDNINDYYDISLKHRNIALLQTYPNFTFLKEDIRDTNVIQQFCPFKIIHLASMAGVRYSIEHPQLYFDVNVNGFIHLLQEATKVNVKSIIYASIQFKPVIVPMHVVRCPWNFLRKLTTNCIK